LRRQQADVWQTEPHLAAQEVLADAQVLDVAVGQGLGVHLVFDAL
jgi:hypothetical protein